jgi:tRNA uridine 5-carbamoylmethylation protein Kti12
MGKKEKVYKTIRGLYLYYMNLLELLEKRNLLTEGIHDAAIFKCVFFAGGPGAGKSHIAIDLFNIPKNLPLSSYGLKLVSSDMEFEFLLKKQNISTDMSKLSDEEFKKLTVGPESIRSRALALTKKKLELYRNSMLGVIIDGSGQNIQKVQYQKKIMGDYGYDCFMIFVNTNLDVSLQRNAKRARKLPDELVKSIWKICQENLGHFQNIFGSNFRIVDNSTPGISIDKSVIRAIIEFVNKPVQNYIGRNKIKNYFNVNSKVGSLEKQNDKENPDDMDFQKRAPIRPRSIGKIKI